MNSTDFLWFPGAPMISWISHDFLELLGLLGIRFQRNSLDCLWFLGALTDCFWAQVDLSPFSRAGCWLQMYSKLLLFVGRHDDLCFHRKLRLAFIHLLCCMLHPSHGPSIYLPSFSWCIFTVVSIARITLDVLGVLCLCVNRSCPSPCVLSPSPWLTWLPTPGPGW